MEELLKKTAAEQSRALANKEVSAVELTKATIDKIKAVDEKLGAFNSLTENTALETAKKVDEKISKGEELPLLAGVPLALKDNMNLVGSKTTASSKILENFVSPFNATITEKLLGNLIPIVGKANLDEFAMGSSNENSAFNKVHNPWDLNKVPGGSSGGCAASVSSCEATLALGSDTGGSIRLPASFCGIVGMKPTYGRVSRYGLIAFASSLDQIGPITRNVLDNALLLNILCSKDERDLTQIGKEEDFTSLIGKDISGMKIAIPSFYISDVIDKEILDKFNSVKSLLEEKGCFFDVVDIPYIDYAVPLYQVIALGEASSNLARFDGIKYGYSTGEFSNTDEFYSLTRSEGFGDEVKRRIMIGSFMLSGENVSEYY